MKQLKKFQNKTELDNFIEGNDAIFPLIALTEEEHQTYVIKESSLPTIYYTTSNGNEINGGETGLQDYILSHTKESDGEFKIVFKNTINKIPDVF